MDKLHIYDEDAGEMEVFHDVSDVIVTADGGFRLRTATGEKTSTGVLFKAEGRCKVYVDPFHDPDVQKFKNIIDPVLMPGGILKLERADGVTVRLRGEILRIKDFNNNDTN